MTVPSFAINICAPRPNMLRRVIRECPTCERRTRQVIAFCVWIGEDVTCCVCGERWQDGERCPRPFERGWRQRSAERARVQYAKGKRYTPRELQRAFEAAVEMFREGT